MSEPTDVATSPAGGGSPTPLDIGLLGPLEVARGGRAIGVTGPKQRALLIVLALHAGMPVGSQHLIEALWPNSRSGREVATLQVHVSHLRDVLELRRDESPSVLLTTNAGYVLADTAVRVDIDRFEELTQHARGCLSSDPDASFRFIEEALEMWRGRPLEDVEYEEFAQEEIRRLDLERMQAVEIRAEALIESARDSEAVPDLEALVRSHPTRERPVVLLMRALYRSGRQAESLRVFRRHARHLAEMGLEPSPTATLLEEQILRHDPSLLPEQTISPADVQTGRSVRGYELRDEVGSGSTGVVFRAFQASVGRDVALKVIHPDLARTGEFVRRFAEETKLIARLEHPHIVPLYDFWREPSGAFLVMRWMDGGSLADLLDRSLTMHEIGRIFDQLAAALGFAHSAGVVHRDLTPSNVLFDRAGNAYLSDFRLGVAGIEAGARAARRTSPGRDGPPPEMVGAEGPTVAWDVFGLGALLAQVVSGGTHADEPQPIPASIQEVVSAATADRPADRYPDITAFRSALAAALGGVPAPVPRRVRRNPYKGLDPFDEADRVDFYGREDVIDRLLDLVRTESLVAVIGASGSGKSSLVKAGLVPSLRDGALPGSDEWFIVHMKPGSHPFDGFHLGLRETAWSHQAGKPPDRSRELREAFDAALDGPNAEALLVIDQFEEIFSPHVDDEVRQRFLDNLVDLVLDPRRRFKILLTLRADFSARPLSHPTFGDLLAAGSMVLATMPPARIEDVVRLPAARVGVEVEPGLISEIVRDVAAEPAYLPLLQYLLSELFERRVEDRLTVATYRSLGGVRGVVQRQAETTFSSLDPSAQRACRQIFLRLLEIGEDGQETRRRLALSELRGVGEPEAVDACRKAFSDARILTHDRDPVTREPTVEVAHETVLHHWSRLRVWVDEAGADLVAQRRLAASAATWLESDEDPSYLLTGGPLATALDLATDGRLTLNRLEERFVYESEQAAVIARRREAARHREEIELRQRARRRLAFGILGGVVAVLVGLLGLIAFRQGQRADRLAEIQERESLARRAAAASVAALDGADHDLSLLLALWGAEQSLDAGGDVLPEIVDALHRSILRPRPSLEVAGVAQGPQSDLLASWSDDGEWIAFTHESGGAAVIDSETGEETLITLPEGMPDVFGVEVHPNGEQLLTIHSDAVRLWEWSAGTLELEVDADDLALDEDAEITTASLSGGGSLIAVGASDGAIRVWDASSLDVIRLPSGRDGHELGINSVDFDPTGHRLVSAGEDKRALVWDLSTQTVIARAPGPIVAQVLQAVWHPTREDLVAVTLLQQQTFVFNVDTGHPVVFYSSGDRVSLSIDVDPSGFFVAGAGFDGFIRVYAIATGGAPIVELPNGGVPVQDVEFDPSVTDPEDLTTAAVASVGTDGILRVWRNPAIRSELPARYTALSNQHVTASRSGDRYLIAGAYKLLPRFDEPPFVEVVDASSGHILLRLPSFRRIGDARRRSDISPDGSRIAFHRSEDGFVAIVDVDSGDTTAIPDSAAWKVLDFSSDGTMLAGGSWIGADGAIALWDAETGKRVDLLMSEPLEMRAFVNTNRTPGSVADLAFRPGSGDLAWTRWDGTVHVWDTGTGEDRVLHRFVEVAHSVSYSPDGSLLAASDITGQIVVLDADTGELAPTQLDPVPGITSLVFSPDGKYVAGAGPGRATHLWDVESGRIVRRFRGPFVLPESAAFVNGGTELRVAGGGGSDLGYVINVDRLIELARAEADGGALSPEQCLEHFDRPCGDST